MSSGSSSFVFGSEADEKNVTEIWNNIRSVVGKRYDFRPSGRSNRSGRGQVEHNVLEGLPIHQYREIEVTVGSHSQEKPVEDRDAWPELPMPRDSHLLPEHSQQLLRAARAGRMYKPPAPVDDEKENLDDEDENKETQKGFSVRKYVKVPRHLEEPEPEYLAKRRKGLPSQYSVYSGIIGPLAQTGAMRETKVQKVDSEGNVNVYKVLVPEGQTVDGEVKEDEVVAEAVPAPAAPGTVVEGVGVVNAEGVVIAGDAVQQTPPRRRPPPPKRKPKKGPGRGKKKVAFEPGAEGTGENGTSANGVDGLGVPTVKTEGGSANPSDVDTPMADAHDGEDDEVEEGEEGEEGSDDEDREDGELSPTPADAITPANVDSEPIKEPVPTLEPVPEPLPEVLPEVLPEAVPEAMPEPVVQEAVHDPIVPEAMLEPVLEPPPQEPAEPAAAPPPAPEAEFQVQPKKDPSSSPDLPLATAVAHSRQNSLTDVPTTTVTEEAPTVAPAEEVHFSDGEPDLLGSLERHLENESKSSADLQ